MKYWLILLVFAFVVQAPERASAQPEPTEVEPERSEPSSADTDSVQRAAELFRQAAAARGELRMSDARALLTESLALDPHAPTAYNLALVLVEVGVFAEAAKVAGDLLEGRYGPLAGAQTQAVRQLQTEAEASLAVLEIRSAASITLELLVDGVQVGGLEPGAIHRQGVDPGPHSVLLLSERGRANRRVTASSGETVALRITDEDFALRSDPATEDDEASGPSPWLWVALGVLVIGAGVTVGVLATRSSEPESVLPVRFVLSSGR